MTNSNKVSISNGNSKMGNVPSVSLPPIVTCPKGCPCAKKCYAAKLCKIRKNVREAYARNLRILKEDPASYWLQVKAAACMTCFFRFHVSGDIPDTEYFENMVKTARDLPRTKFLAFTKQYFIVNHWLDNNGGKLPDNLQIVFSEWGEGWEVLNPYSLPTAAVVFKGREPKDGWKVCGGNCADCACRGVGCWELKKGETICFNEH